MARGRGGGHHGGSWKVAYADFVTSMMAMFLVLWIVSNDVEVREAVQGYFRGELKSPQGAGFLKDQKPGPEIFRNTEHSSKDIRKINEIQRVAENLEALLRNSPEMGEDVIRFEFLADGIRITALDKSKRPFFEPDTATLTPFGEWVLNTIAYQIERYPGFLVEVEGHTQKGGEAGGNTKQGFSLSAQRAITAKNTLNYGGVKEDAFWRVAGYGDRVPLEPEKPESEENRRITIVIRPGSERDLYQAIDKLAEDSRK